MLMAAAMAAAMGIALAMVADMVNYCSMHVHDRTLDLSNDTSKPHATNGTTKLNFITDAPDFSSDVVWIRFDRGE